MVLLHYFCYYINKFYYTVSLSWRPFYTILTCYYKFWQYELHQINTLATFIFRFNILWHFKMEAKQFFQCFKCHTIFLRPKATCTVVTGAVWQEVKCSQTSLLRHTKGLIHLKNKKLSAGKACWDIQEAEEAEQILAAIRAHSFTWGEKTEDPEVD